MGGAERSMAGGTGPAQAGKQAHERGGGGQSGKVAQLSKQPQRLCKCSCKPPLPERLRLRGARASSTFDTQRLRRTAAGVGSRAKGLHCDGRAAAEGTQISMVVPVQLHRSDRRFPATKSTSPGPAGSSGAAASPAAAGGRQLPALPAMPEAHAAERGPHHTPQHPSSTAWQGKCG